VNPPRISDRLERIRIKYYYASLPASIEPKCSDSPKNSAGFQVAVRRASAGVNPESTSKPVHCAAQILERSRRSACPYRENSDSAFCMPCSKSLYTSQQGTSGVCIYTGEWHLESLAWPSLQMVCPFAKREVTEIMDVAPHSQSP
jgi:hypothetical protein